MRRRVSGVGAVTAALVVAACSQPAPDTSAAGRAAETQPEVTATHAAVRPAATPAAKPALGAGASLHGRRPFPAADPWNTRVDRAPVDPRSAALIASIGASAHLHPDFGANWDGGPFGIPYVVVGGTQKRVPVTFDYADESDRGPY